ncbi:MAG TPA: sigma factor, partial [Polyangiaceae bacterium]|nr:sigma factor [Polyangiaceae bacterium]
MPSPFRAPEAARHAPWVRRLAASLARGDDPDDLAQEAWLAVLRFPPPEGVPARSWFVGVTRRLAYVRRRGERRRALRDAD